MLLFKAAVFIFCALPLLQIPYWFYTGSFSPNPVEDLEHHTGETALVMLLATLAMTPIARMFAVSWPIRIRRMLGLWCFTYVTLHFSIYLVFDLSFDPAVLAEDLVKRRYITVGFLAWLLLIPLAITSTNGWQRRLKRRWKKLHKLVYPIAILGVLHFLWLVKKDMTEPLIYAAILSALLLLRSPVGQKIRLRKK